MKRISLFVLALVLPTLFAIWFAVSMYRTKARQATTRAMFERQLEDDGGWNFEAGRLVRDLGKPTAIEMLTKAAESEWIVFDGADRVARVQKEGMRYETGSLDIIQLHSVESDRHVAIHQPPIGTVVDRVQFTPAGLLVTLHGDLLRSRNDEEPSIFVPAESPEDYLIPWVNGKPPASPNLESLIRARHPLAK